jgi:hypothetical protein
MLEEREVEEEDKVILRDAGAMVVFAGVEEGEARVALFDGRAEAREGGSLVLDVDSHGVKMAALLLADC